MRARVRSLRALEMCLWVSSSGSREGRATGPHCGLSARPRARALACHSVTRLTIGASAGRRHSRSQSHSHSHPRQDCPELPWPGPSPHKQPARTFHQSGSAVRFVSLRLTNFHTNTHSLARSLPPNARPTPRPAQRPAPSTRASRVTRQRLCSGARWGALNSQVAASRQTEHGASRRDVTRHPPSWWLTIAPPRRRLSICWPGGRAFSLREAPLSELQPRAPKITHSREAQLAAPHSS